MSETIHTVTLAEPVIIAGERFEAGEARVNARQRHILRARGLLVEPAADASEQTEHQED